MKEVREKIIVPLDVSSREQALALVQQLHDLVGLFKVGSQLFTACGPEIVLEIIKIGGKVFLDLKFHDIPNTVTHAAIEAGKLGVSMMTVHASGGRAMLESASKELHKQFGAKKPLLLAITVLTSLDTKSLFEIGVEVPVEEQVQRSAIFAQECGKYDSCGSASIPVSKSSRPAFVWRITRLTTSSGSQRLTKRSQPGQTTL
jgi:orotidine-5'-phosphate decarboxylase